jgi:endoglycosylceramidase
MWAGVEPVEGKINTTYVNILKNITKEFEQMGIYVILDMHQDVLWQAGPNEDQG